MNDFQYVELANGFKGKAALITSSPSDRSLNSQPNGIAPLTPTSYILKGVRQPPSRITLENPPIVWDPPEDD